MKKTKVYISEQLEGNFVYKDEESAKEAVGDDYFEYDAWYCEHDGLPEVFLSEEDAEKHDMMCPLNPDNKTILTSKFLGVELYPPYPRFAREGRDRYLQDAIGKHTKPYDIRTGKYLKDKELYKPLKDWESVEYDPIGQRRRPEVVRTKAYNHFLKLMDEAEKEENEKLDNLRERFDLQ